MTVSLTVNGNRHQIDASPETPLLYVLRNDLGLNGANMAVGQGNAGPAPCNWMARPCSHA
jgi:isoquinoline 1-oxidoreductase